jgi:hypothetical protein
MTSDVETQLANRWWRLNNLYTIVDDSGHEMVFRPNWAQVMLFQNMWYCNLLLKARQLGLTTAICIFFLDIAMFNSNTNCGIIAHNKEDAEKFFRNKIKFAYDKLPEALRKAIPANTDTARELRFSNGSSISVGTSMRSTTLQYLHISEHGKLCAKYPEKAREIRTGALNTVAVGNYVFIESTAEGRTGDFFDFAQLALNNQRAGKELTPMDYRFFFFPWWRHPKYCLPYTVEHPRELIEYYEDLRENYGILLSEEQKNWYTKKYETQQDEMKREFPSTPEEAFESAIHGAYYAKQLARTRLEGRTGYVPHDEAALVHTCWDLGISDAMVLWAFQLIHNEIHWINYYENTDEGFAHYKGQMDAWSQQYGYIYGQHFAPHDIGARELSSGQTRQMMAAKLGLSFYQLPKLDIQTGINLARGGFARCFFDRKCELGLSHLGNYVKEWNAKMNMFSDTPRHDEHEHGASAFRYGMQAIMQGLVSNELSLSSNREREKALNKRAAVAV